MSNINPLVSVITAVKNGKDTIERCLQSVSTQTYTNIQHVIIDGNSTDGTESVLNLQAKNSDVLIARESDAGIYDAINKGIHMSSGTFLLVLGSDDWLEPTGIERLVSSVINSDADFAVGSAQVHSKTDSTLNRLWKINNFDHRILTGGMPFSHQALLASRDCYDMCGLYNMAYKISADYEWIKKLFLKKLRLAVVNDCVVNVSADGMSAESLSWKQEHLEQFYEYYKDPSLLSSLSIYIEYINHETQLEEQEISKIISNATNIDIIKSIALTMLDRLCKKTNQRPLMYKSQT
jgi:glycosyltransferase involved in cell wall biosynthesis